MEAMDGMAEKLASLIRDAVRADFEAIHLTGKLRDTVTVEKSPDGGVVVKIPAEAYDLGKLLRSGVIVPRPDLGSYAELVNKTGGLSRMHKGYVERAIDRALVAWLKYYGIKAEVLEDG